MCHGDSTFTITVLRVNCLPFTPGPFRFWWVGHLSPWSERESVRDRSRWLLFTLFFKLRRFLRGVSIYYYGGSVSLRRTTLPQWRFPWGRNLPSASLRPVPLMGTEVVPGPSGETRNLPHTVRSHPTPNSHQPPLRTPLLSFLPCTGTPEFESCPSL